MNQFIEETRSLAPIILFAYKRPYELQQTITHILANSLASKSILYIYVDGPKCREEESKVLAIHQLVSKISGFREVHRIYSPINKGLANSIIEGVTEVIQRHGSAIVLEDDLLISSNFLDFMNQCLKFYKNNSSIFSITGFTFPVPRPTKYLYDAYLFPRTGSWGWATWVDRWEMADWAILDFDQFMADKQRKRHFNEAGSDRVRMLQRWKNQKIDSWAIRWCYAQEKVNGLTVYPTYSKVQNIGFSPDSTNTHVFNRFKTVLDDSGQQVFCLPESPELEDYYLKHIRWQFSIPVRILNRIRSRFLKN